MAQRWAAAQYHHRRAGRGTALPAILGACAATDGRPGPAAGGEMFLRGGPRSVHRAGYTDHIHFAPRRTGQSGDSKCYRLDRTGTAARAPAQSGRLYRLLERPRPLGRPLSAGRIHLHAGHVRRVEGHLSGQRRQRRPSRLSHGGWARLHRWSSWRTLGGGRR